MHILEVAEEKIDRVSLLPSRLGGWINFFYYSHQISEEDMSALINNNPILQQAYTKFQQFNQDERLRALDRAHQQYLHDLATDIEEAHEKGWKGGEAKKARETATNLRNMGMSPSDISKATGLSPEEIEGL
jgi:predicted transposase/invertase (TIGR01784 family)